MSSRAVRLQRRLVDADHEGFCVVRTPLLPVDDLIRWQAATGGLDEPHDIRMERARDHLRSLLHKSEVLEALFLASPSTVDSIPVWLSSPTSTRGRRIERTLVRYLSRMAGRPTPFGLCAGCSIATVDSSSLTMRLGARGEYQRHSRIDQDYLEMVRSHLLGLSTTRHSVRYFTNDTLYNFADQIRYAEGKMAFGGRSYQLVAVRPTDYLLRTLDRAKAGATFGELAGQLVLEADVSIEEAEEYLNELVSTQVLLSELLPGVTTGDPEAEFVQHASGIPSAAHAATAVAEAVSSLKALDAGGLGTPPQTYRTIASQLEALPVKPSLSRLFQVDMMKPMEGGLDKSVIEDLLEGVEIVRTHTVRWTDPWRRFRERFTERYERAMVPLLEVIDDEAGIGFDGVADDPQPLIDGLPLSTETQLEMSFSPREEWLLRRLIDLQGGYELSIDGADIPGTKPASADQLPGAFAVTAAVGMKQDGARYVFFRNVAGPSGARMLGRFCHCDARLRDSVRQHLKHEEALRPKSLYAEIVHLPSGRMGNIQSRPSLRDFEIPILCRSGVSEEHRIHLSDLLLTVNGDRVILFSRRLRCEVVPRMSTAHNYRKGLSVYRFLCSLQSQGTIEGMGWTWGPFQRFPFLPRVVAGRVVLARAQWRLDEEQLARLAKSSPEEGQVFVQTWRIKFHVPRWILVLDGDNEMPVDLDNVLSVDMLVDLVADRKMATVAEMLPAPTDLVVHGPEGSFVHDLVVPFVRRAPKVQGPAFPLAEADPGWRRLPLGSDWLFAKIYTGTGNTDVLLREAIGPLAADLQREGICDRWFFIRYADPEWHVRVRFHGDPQTILSVVLGRLQASLADRVKSGMVWRWTLDTYVREVERYGGPVGLALAERIFHVDSEFAIELLESGAANAATRWRTVIRSFDRILDDMGFDLVAKAALMKALRANAGRQYEGNRRLKTALAARFRFERRRLEDSLEGKERGEGSAEMLATFDRRSFRLKPLFAELRSHEASGSLVGSVVDLAPAYLHMHANRLLRTSSVKHEFVMYDLLDRTYQSRVARLGSPTKA